MASMWTRLGLKGPSTDLTAIKRAYAAQLNIIPPADDVEAYMALKDAYEQARDYARAYADEPIPSLRPTQEPDTEARAPLKPITIADPDSAEVDGIPISDFMPEDFDPDARPQIEPAEHAYGEGSVIPVVPGTKELDGVMGKVAKVMSDPWRRNNANAWKDIFDDPVLDSTEAFTDFDYALRDYLLQFFGHFDDDPRRHNRAQKPRPISTFVATFIFDTMNWHDALPREPWVQQQIDVLREDFDVLSRQRKKQTSKPDKKRYEPETRKKRNVTQRRRKTRKRSNGLSKILIFVFIFIAVRAIANSMGFEFSD